MGKLWGLLATGMSLFLSFLLGKQKQKSTYLKQERDGQRDEAQKLLICLMMMSLLLSSCKTVSDASRIMPKISVHTDECVLKAYRNGVEEGQLPDCVKGALRQWMVLTK